MTFICSTCGSEHDLSQLSFGAEAPLQWVLLSEEEQRESDLSGEQCVIRSNEETHFFIRARLEIPILGKNIPFVWGVWCSLSEANFNEIAEHWDNPNRIHLGPYFGWLCTKIPEYPDTMFLKCSVRQVPPGLRPIIELAENDHLLVQHQKLGVDSVIMQTIATRVLHSQ